MSTQSLEYMIMLDTTTAQQHYQHQQLLLQQQQPEQQQQQQQLATNATALNEQLRKENEQLKRKLYRANSELGKLHNKINEISTERESCKQVLLQVQQHLATHKGDQRTINLVLKNALAVLSQFKTRAQATVVTHGDSVASGSNSGKLTAAQQAALEAEKPYPCDWTGCGKRFGKKQHLEVHKNIHIGVRHFCTFPNCSKSFVRKYNLNEHMKMHQSVCDNTCSYPGCGKVFSSRFSLNRHQSAQHSTHSSTEHHNH